MLPPKLAIWCAVAATGVLSCSPAYALTLKCEMGVSFGTRMGPPKIYVLTIEDGDGFVTGTSADGRTNKLAIVKRTEMDGGQALVLNNGSPDVQGTLVLSHEPRMIIVGNGFTQTDLCQMISDTQ